MAQCAVCGTGGGFGNAVWRCPACDKEFCNNDLKKAGRFKGGILGQLESATCIKCGTGMRKIAW